MQERDLVDAQNEVEVLRSLNHPNITRFVESWECSKRIVIVMEYADGGDLAIRIRRQRLREQPFSESEIMAFFIQASLALKYLHFRKTLHRDVKCLNVFLTSTDVVKLGDFGSAKHVGTVGIANTVCGTYNYFSPELSRNEPYSSKSDIWALGVVLYELITLGQKPFQAPDLRGLMLSINTDEPIPLPCHDEHSDGVRDTCLRMLAKDPLERPGIVAVLTSQYMRQQLEEFAKMAQLKEERYRERCAQRQAEQQQQEQQQKQQQKQQQQQHQQQHEAAAQPAAEQKKGIGKLFGRLFGGGKEQKPQPKKTAARHADTVRMKQGDLAGKMKGQPPPEYQAELARLQTEKRRQEEERRRQEERRQQQLRQPVQERRGSSASTAVGEDAARMRELGCVPNYEATVRDCGGLAALASSCSGSSDADPAFDEVEQTGGGTQRKQLEAELTPEQLRECQAVLAESGAGDVDAALLDSRLERVLGSDKMHLVQLVSRLGPLT
eukprot:TRINITY_DN3185_c4_g1_i1.p1 TRINITY_DN3185_c4_g1~~TRINITY_DN3185_c4_g1_i1.p1  ORF type:complete len:495 (+),score=186.91 TRINITY_DN3185_c4_g1_i1:219-1703(+)